MTQCPSCNATYISWDEVELSRIKHVERIANVAGQAMVCVVTFEKLPNTYYNYDRITKICDRPRKSFKCHNCGFEWDQYPRIEFIRGD